MTIVTLPADSDGRCTRAGAGSVGCAGSAGSPFTEALEQWRRRLRLGHNAFARYIGISHGYWHQLRTGDKTPSFGLVRRLVAERPALKRPAAASYLLPPDARAARRASRSPVRR